VSLGILEVPKSSDRGLSWPRVEGFCDLDCIILCKPKLILLLSPLSTFDYLKKLLPRQFLFDKFCGFDLSNCSLTSLMLDT
jgi:hypothetical protein